MAPTPPLRQQQTGGDGHAASIDRLPLALVRDQIFSFLSQSMDALREDSFRPRDCFYELSPLRHVCQRWHMLVSEMVQDARIHAQKLHFTTASPHLLHDVEQRAQLNGSRARQLEIVSCITRPRDDMYNNNNKRRRLHRSMTIHNLLEVPWSRLLSSFRNIVRLDLSETRPSRVLPTVLGQASALCPSVQALVLPSRLDFDSEDSDDEDEDDIVPHDMTHSLVQALAKWHDSNGGLRLLHVPWWPEDDKGEYNELLAAITAYCPRLQFLCGWDADNRYYGGETTMLGNVSHSVWTAFCSQCTQLREFNWRMVPLTKPFVEEFSKYPKPHLRELVIGDGYAISDNGDQLGFTDLTILCPLFTGSLPRLRLFYLQLDEWPGQVRGGGITADQLAVQIAESCPYLESFGFWIQDPDDDATLTSTGITALAQCPFLTDLTVSKARMEPDGLVQLVRLRGQRKRRIHMSVLDDECPDAILELLEFLQQTTTPADIATGQMLDLNISGCSPSGDCGALPEVYEGTYAKMMMHAELEARAAALQSQYAETPLILHFGSCRFSHGPPQQKIYLQRMYKCLLSSVSVVINDHELDRGIVKYDTTDCGPLPATVEHLE